MTKLGIIAIIITKPNEDITLNIQKLLTSYAHLIIGRLGIPDRESNHNIITITVKGTGEEILSLESKLNQMKQVISSSTLTEI